MNELKKYITDHPGVKKTWLSDKLGISRPTLDNYLKTDRPLNVELKAKVKALK